MPGRSRKIFDTMSSVPYCLTHNLSLSHTHTSTGAGAATLWNARNPALASGSRFTPTPWDRGCECVHPATCSPPPPSHPQPSAPRQHVRCHRAHQCVWGVWVRGVGVCSWWPVYPAPDLLRRVFKSLWRRAPPRGFDPCLLEPAGPHIDDGGYLERQP